MNRAFSPWALVTPGPGAMPQAGMAAAHRPCLKPPLDRIWEEEKIKIKFRDCHYRAKAIVVFYASFR